MKFLSAMFFLSLSLNVLATCPNLQGDYTCEIPSEGSGFSYDISAVQSGSGNNMTYTLTEHNENIVTTVVTNNQWQIYSMPEGFVSLKASCQNNLLIIDGIVKGIDGTEINFNQENSVLNSQQVQIKTILTFMGYSDVIIEICTRK